MFEGILAGAFAYAARSVSGKIMLLEGSDGTYDSREAWPKALPLYAHIPFCRSLCPFCSFNRYSFLEARAKSYYAQISRELELYAEKGYSFSALHVGGGTPTVMVDELALFIDKARSLFNIRYIDVESTPNEISDESVNTLRSAGVRRLSVGVQSFDDSLLKELGRYGYSPAEALERLSIACGRFNTVGIDLLFNLPSQSRASFMNDILIFKDSGIEQVTFYPLMPGPHKNTLMERKMRDYSLARSRPRESAFYNLILKLLLNNGYTASSAWCFNKHRESSDEYIINDAEYIGIGSGSISLLSDAVYVNTFSLEKYSQLVSVSRLPIVRFMKLKKRDYLMYRLLMSLFGMRISSEALEEYGPVAKELATLRLLGIIRHGDNGFEVTRHGMYYVNVLMSEFFSSLNALRERFIEKQV